MEVPLRATKLGNAEVDGHRGPGEQIWKQKMDHMSVSNNHWAGDYFKHGHKKKHTAKNLLCLSTQNFSLMYNETCE